MIDKVAVIKTGWSDDYKGSPVEADHQYVKDVKDGHEKFNFLPGPDGRFYAYTPPLGDKWAAPKPKDRDGWLVFAVAKRPKRPGLYLTGWYENATFAGEYLDKIEYSRDKGFPLDDQGTRFSYTLSSSAAVQIDPDETPHIFPGDYMKRSPVYYLRGNGDKQSWREDLAYEVDDRQKDNCGFDLLVRPARNPKAELHIEVKGTQNSEPHFLMSRREYAYMLANPNRWRLAMVTKALSVTPELKVMDASEARQHFFWEEFAWHATSKPKTRPKSS